MPAPRFSLRVELGDGQAFSVELARARTILGRGASTDLPVRAEGVSREHAALVVDGADLWLEDLGSTNGTQLNGARVQARTRLADGDELALGRARITVQVDARQAVEALGSTPGEAPAGPPVGASLVSTLVASDEDEPPPARLDDDQRALRSLYQLGRALDPGVSGGELRRRVVDVAVAALDADRVVLRLGDDVLAHGDGEPIAEVVARVAQEGRAVLTLAGERSVAVVPMAVRELTPAWLYADAALARRRFTPRDLDLLTIVAQSAAALVDNGRLLAQLRAARDLLAADNAALRGELAGKFGFPGILGGSGALEAVLKTVTRLAQTDSTVLVTGESGTGKELIARTIHFNSARKAEPFVAINCAAIPENLIEAELFGIEKGVATGVDKRTGKFEAAGEGTLFLDEIGELPLGVQAKLLRVLEERTVERVGSHKPLPMRARIVAATNRALAAEVAAGRFREDLYYRLNVVPVRLPPLRERPTDIRVLAEAFLRRFADKQGRPIRGLSEGAIAALEAWHWPGNVRELQNELERAVTIWEPRGEGEAAVLLHAEHLSEHVRAAEARPTHFAEELEVGDIKDVVGKLVERAERQLIKAALARTSGNRARAAQLLGLTREGLRKKLIRYGMAPGAGDEPEGND